MAQYAYVAVNRSGVKVQGQIEASGENDLRVMLRAQSLRPLKIQKIKAAGAGLAASLSVLTGRISDTEVLLFTRQLSILIGAGIPLVQGLEIIQSQITSRPFRNMLISIREKVSSGSFLWESLAQQKLVFSDIYVSMVKAGEASGALDVILKRLMRYLEESIKLKKMVQSAMVYPITVSIVGMGVLFIMLTFVIPKFEDMLASNNQELPDITKFVIDASHFTQAYAFHIVGASAVLVMLLGRYLATVEGKNFFDAVILKVPLFGNLTKKVAVARFSRTMQTMLSSGINLLDSLDIARGAVGNNVYSSVITKLKTEVESGKTLSDTLAKQPLFPGMMVQMVTVGETAGNLDNMLERVADFYEEEVTNLVGNMTKLLEPIILVVLGGMVAGLMVAMYLPIFKMGG